MRTICTMVALVFLSSMSQTAAQHQKSAEAIFRRCSACHGTPDASLAGDRVWIGRIATTACVLPLAPKVAARREGLIEWLRGPRVHRPAVERKARKAARGEGLVSARLGQCSVLLVPAEASDSAAPVRLVFDDKPASEATRALAAGRWVVRNYKVFRTDQSGRAWQIWASGKGQEIRVMKGKKPPLELDLRVHLRTNVRLRGGKLRVGIGVTGDKGMGLTVIAAGDRVPATYVLKGRGKDLASGSMKYG